MSGAIDKVTLEKKVGSEPNVGRCTANEFQVHYVRFASQFDGAALRVGIDVDSNFILAEEEAELCLSTSSIF